MLPLGKIEKALKAPIDISLGQSAQDIGPCQSIEG
jgi:hypothetical protein